MKRQISRVVQSLNCFRMKLEEQIKDSFFGVGTGSELANDDMESRISVFVPFICYLGTAFRLEEAFNFLIPKGLFHITALLTFANHKLLKKLIILRKGVLLDELFNLGWHCSF
jgi:hypothetical protein